MMKKIAITLCVALSLLLVYNATFAQDFTVVSPTTDKYNGLCKPIKAGSSFQLQVKIKNNKNVTCTVSIDANA